MTGVGRKNRTRVGQPRAVLLRVDRFCLQLDVTKRCRVQLDRGKKREEAVKEREATRVGESRIQNRPDKRPRNLEGATVDSWTGDGWGLGGGFWQGSGGCWAGVLGSGVLSAAKRLHTSNALTGPLSATRCKARPRGDLCIRPPPYLHQAATFVEEYQDPAISGQPS